jgi:hypothetical protein
MIEPLQQAIVLGNRLKEIAAEIKKKEQEVKELKATYTVIEGTHLPELFEELGVTGITLSSGTNITMSKFPVGRITDLTRDEAYTWLRENNHGGIIKDSFKVGLGIHEEETSNRLKDFLTANRIPFENKEDIHNATLKSFIREQSEEEGFPKELFNVFEVKKVEFRG